MQQWMEAIKTCIEEEEAHETRQLVPLGCCSSMVKLYHPNIGLQGKDEVKGNAAGVEEDDDLDEPEEEINCQGSPPIISCDSTSYLAEMT